MGLQKVGDEPAMGMDGEGDEAYHQFQIKLILTQRELLSLRRVHENEVLSMEASLEEKESLLDEAERSLHSLHDKNMEKADKLKALNAELSEVQLILLQTQKDHNKLSKKLKKSRETVSTASEKISQGNLDNEARRTELKAHNRTLAVKQTELIGHRHEMYVMRQAIGQMEGEDIGDMDLDELQELEESMTKALASVEEAQSDWLDKQLEWYESEISFALADEDYA